MIETVLGPLPPERLGPTSMHEHLLSDATALGVPDPPGGPADNSRLDDAGLATEELALAGAAGVSAVLDPTVWGFGGPSPELAGVSRRSGVQVVAGVGAYLPATRPGWLRRLDQEGLEALLRSALLERLPGCEFRAGAIGMLAPGHPLDEEDRRLLRAAGTIGAATGAAALVRLDPRHRDGPEVLELLDGAGLAPERVVLSNVDGYARDPEPLRELAAAGATLKWCFGYEAPPRAGLAAATDAERATALAELLAAGHERQVLACGVWTRAALRAGGGFGYEHLVSGALPLLRERGLGEAELANLLVEQPRRLLDRG